MEQIKVTMKELPESERPYEKLEQSGAQALSDAELLAIVLRTGTRRERVYDVACRCLMEAGRASNGHSNLASLFNMPQKRLMAMEGIGRIKSIQLMAVMEIAKRIAEARAVERFRADDPETIAARYMEALRYQHQEIVLALFLNRKNQRIAERRISIGTQSLAVASTRDVFAAALEHQAGRLVLLHNHPSGDPTPSASDLQTTTRMVQAGQLLEIEVLDHIIIGNGVYYSMKEHGQL